MDVGTNKITIQKENNTEAETTNMFDGYSDRIYLVADLIKGQYAGSNKQML